jgi:hypothetical protein
MTTPDHDDPVQSRDVGAAARGYAEHLGFNITGSFPGAEPFGWASIGRDGVEIMFLRLQGYQKPDLRALRPEGLWDAYIRMNGVHACFDTLKDQSFIQASLVQQSYGDWEFEIRDPNGYVVVFSG